MADSSGPTPDDVSRATLRPLVICGMDGGLHQWTVLKPGYGEPQHFVLDYDIDGLPLDDLGEFIGFQRQAISALDAYGDPDDLPTLTQMLESLGDIQETARLLALDEFLDSKPGGGRLIPESVKQEIDDFQARPMPPFLR